MKILKRILVILLVVFIVLQAFRPGKNNVSANTANSITKNYAVPDNVKVILAKACNDCHSNKTKYPWYTNVQPVGWWIDDHIEEGKLHLNFDEYSNYRIARQYKKLEDCIEEVKEGDMPIESYTLIHKEAVLTEAEKQTLYKWCTDIRDSIKVKYPADSLVIKRKK